MTLARSLWQQATRHWFVALLPLLLLIEYCFARTTNWTRPGPAETAILFDLCLFVPALFLLCYRRRYRPLPLLLRAGSLVLLGLYLATLIVPPEGQMLLARFDWLRPLGLALLMLAELTILIGIVRLAFSDRANADEIAKHSGTPNWVARLMLLEARFWKWVWRKLRRH